MWRAEKQNCDRRDAFIELQRLTQARVAQARLAQTRLDQTKLD